ncbi:hypothetical protein Q2K19_22415 [Micromonospora soli]|uniref:hypothetical protein n=1 Tax=Micromonospora sp. NBRC 110009 TaxID=3061627 RepID=UPI0026726241|nr:hypothetical protein [Micromonospora sp. NBRC 110009]WKT96923.1 hypothetical protein Q2K19_22415 [Micromonospora sp. NBRC 110009]
MSTPIGSSDVPVVHESISDLGSILDAWLAARAEGIACVIGDPTFRATSRVRSLTPELSKGLEFDLVVLIDPEAFGDGIEGRAGFRRHWARKAARPSRTRAMSVSSL